MFNIHNISISKLLYMISLIFIIAVSACDNSKPNHTILSRSEETWNREPSVTVKVKVDKSITKSKLESLLIDILIEQYSIGTKYGVPKLVTVEAYFDDNPISKQAVGSVHQAFGGRVAFVYEGETNYKLAQLPGDIYDKIKLQENVGKSYDNNTREDFIFENVEKNDPTCKNSMIKVRNKFGKPDELVEVVPGTATIIFRKKGLSFTFEAEGNNCNITSSNF